MKIIEASVAVWRWSVSLWRFQQRRIDIDILWPECLSHARDLNHAKAAFTMHAMNDPAWQELGEAETLRFIDGLERVPTGGVEL